MWVSISLLQCLNRLRLHLQKADSRGLATENRCIFKNMYAIILKFKYFFIYIKVQVKLCHFITFMCKNYISRIFKPMTFEPCSRFELIFFSAFLLLIVQSGFEFAEKPRTLELKTVIWKQIEKVKNEMLRSVHANSQEQLQSCVFKNLRDVIFST